MGATAEYLFRVKTNSHTNPLDIKRGNQSLLGDRGGSPFLIGYLFLTRD